MAATSPNHRDIGNNLFKAGKFKDAIDAYTKGIDDNNRKFPAQNSDERAALLNNRAAARLALGETALAASDARACLNLQPESAKAHYRLAKALFPDHEGAAPAIAAAVALTATTERTEEMLALYSTIEHASAQSPVSKAKQGIVLMPLPKDPSRIGLAASSAEVTNAVRQGAELVVLRPGTKVARPVSHTASSIVIREAGALEASHTSIASCRQGVSAYGGARSVQLWDCDITSCKFEGVLAAGTYTNAATEAQRVNSEALGRDWHGPVNSQSARDASLAAEAWGKKRGVQLHVALIQCSITDCGQFGVSADRGASLVAQGCMLSGNDPYSIFIKGGTDVGLLACKVQYSSGKTDSAWAKRMGPGATALGKAGVQVGINYSGTVHVTGCAFVGPEDVAIVEEAAGLITAARKAGMYSKAVNATRNSYHPMVAHSNPGSTIGSTKTVPGSISGTTKQGAGSTAQGMIVPSMEELLMRLPLSMRVLDSAAAAGADDDFMGTSSTAASGVTAGGSRGRRAVAAPSVALMQRPCLTSSGAQWGPTAQEYYAIGNTFGYDVSGGYAATADNSAPVTLLLGACGDIRNLLATAGAATARATATPARMHFTMLDGNLSMLARNAVLLHMAAELSASEDAMLAVWANHALTQQQHDVLIRSCRMLAEEPWPPWLSASYSLSGSSKGSSDGSSSSNTATSSLYGAAAASVTSSASAESGLRGVFAAWAACSMPLSQLLDRRTQMMGTCSSTGLAAQASNKRLKVQPTHISMTIDYSVDLSMAAVAAACGSSKASAEAVRGDVSTYVHSGSLKLEARTQQEPAVAPNPTLLLAPDMQYTVYFSSSIFRALPLAVSRSSTATERLLATLEPQLEVTVVGLREGRVHVTLVHADIIAAMTNATATASSNMTASGSRGITASTITPEFDFIDCSNVADYVSVQALAQAASPILSCKPHARLRMESFVLHQAECSNASGTLSAEAFVQSQLLGGLSLNVFEKLLEMKLLGGQPIPGRESGTRLEWGSAGTASAQPATGQTTGAVPTQQQLSSGSVGDVTDRLTAARLLLELLPACKNGLLPYSCYVGESATARPGPVTLAHLLTLTAPQHADVLWRTLLRCEAYQQQPEKSTAGGSSGSSTSTPAKKQPAGLSASLFKWEVSMHSQGQDPTRSNPVPLSRIAYSAAPGYWLVPHDVHPLLLAFTARQDVLVNRGMPADSAAVKQLLSSFSWDEEQAVAHFLLPTSVAEQCSGWWVTLCAWDKDAGSCTAGLVPVGEPAKVGSLPTVPALALPWAGLQAPASLMGHTSDPSAGSSYPTDRITGTCTHGSFAVQHPLDTSLLDCIALQSSFGSHGGASSAGSASTGGVASGWRSLVHAWSDDMGVTVDVLAGRPLPAADEAAVHVTVLEGALHVQVTSRAQTAGSNTPSQGKKGKGGTLMVSGAMSAGQAAASGSAGAGAGDRPMGHWSGGCEYDVPLPQGTWQWGKPVAVKLSLKLGLLSAMVPKHLA